MKNLIFILIILFSTSALYGQRNIKGINSINLNYGLSKYSIGTYGSVEYSRYIGQRFTLDAGLNFENGYIEDKASLTFNLPYINVGNSYNLFTLENRHGLNIYYGGLLGIEYLTSQRNEIEKQTIVYGLKLGLSYGYLINKKIGVSLSFEENYWHKSLIGNWNYVLKGGVKIYL